MNPTFRSLTRLTVLAAVLGAISAPSIAVTITADTIISSTDTTYDGQDIVVSACTLTANGAHSFHSLALANGAVLTHSAAPAGQPDKRLNLTVTGDLMVPIGCSIRADGLGYASDGGLGVSFGGCYTSGGAGYGGEGGTGHNGCSRGGAAYGSISAPVDFGSGSSGTGGGPPGVSGGGVIQLSVGGALAINGSISANGSNDAQSWDCGGGSGGSVYIIAGSLAGNGPISANGGNADGKANQGGGGGGGRIAVYYSSTTYTGAMTAYGGSGSQIGGAGTVYTKLSSAPRGTLTVANAGAAGAITRLKNAWLGAIAPPTTLLSGACVVYSDDAAVLYSVHMSGNSTWSANSLTTAAITVSGDFMIDSGCAINADGKGFATNSGPGLGFAGCYTSGGAGYGGEGGTGHNGCSAGGATYGSITAPVDFGSGSSNTGAGPPGVSGGGAIALTVGGALTVNGSITAAGSSDTQIWDCGGGSGGSIYLLAGSLAGNGMIAANGGNADGRPTQGGGGGGGRIAIYYNSSTYSGLVTAFGATGSQAGGAGTVYIKPASSTRGVLRIANNGTVGGGTRLWQIYWPGNVVFDTVVDNCARLFAGQPLVMGGLQLTRASQVCADPQLALFITALGDFTVGAGCTVIGDGCGYPSDKGPGTGGNGGYCSGGAGHGGAGGAGYNSNAIGGKAYGSFDMPTELGSGSTSTGGGPPGVSGGGAIHFAVDGAFTLNGIVSANGSSDTQTWDCGGGSGGSIYITCSSLTGAGILRARGGNADVRTTQGGGGGGGRISIVSASSSFGGTIDVSGGEGAQLGGAGSINQVVTGAIAMPGDVDGSGTVTIADAIWALRIAAGFVNSTAPGLHFGNGDVFPQGSPDHRISIEDALRILRHVYGVEALP